MTMKESAQTMKAYRPATGEKPDCGKCEREECFNRGKFQRDRRDFTITSGRCPRLPDTQGEYDPVFYDLADVDAAAIERIVRLLLRRGDSLRDVTEILGVKMPR